MGLLTCLANQFLETFNSTGSVDQILFAGKERMAIRTDFHLYLLQRRAGQERRAAGGAGNLGLVGVGWVNSRFHPVKSESSNVFEKSTDTRKNFSGEIIGEFSSFLTGFIAGSV